MLLIQSLLAQITFSKLTLYAVLRSQTQVTGIRCITEILHVPKKCMNTQSVSNNLTQETPKRVLVTLHNLLKSLWFQLVQPLYQRVQNRYESIFLLSLQHMLEPASVCYEEKNFSRWEIFL